MVDNKNTVYFYFKKGMHKDNNLPVPVFDGWFAVPILLGSLLRNNSKFKGFCHVEIDTCDGRMIGARDNGVRFLPKKVVVLNEDHWFKVAWDVTDTRFPKHYKDIKDFIESCEKDDKNEYPYPWDDIVMQQALHVDIYDNPAWYCSEYGAYKLGLDGQHDNLNPDELFCFIEKYLK